MEEELKELIVEQLFLDISPADIDSATELIEYGVDSFLLLELIVGIELKYGIRIPQEDINSETLKSVNSLKALIESKQQ